MLKVSWVAAHNPVLTGINVNGWIFAHMWDIPTSNPAEYISTHRLSEPSAQPITGSETFGDDNSLAWGPSIPPDNWCEQVAILGSYELDLKAEAFPPGAIWVDEYGNRCVGIGGYKAFVDHDVQLGNSEIHGTDYHFTMIYHGYGYEDTWEITITPYPGFYHRHTVYHNGYWGWSSVEDIDISNLDSGWSGISLQPVEPWMYRDRYANLISYVRRYADAKIWPKLPYNVDEWDATLQAVDGFHPYDLNLVEGFVQLDSEDLWPKNTSSKNLDLINSVVNSRGGFSSPKGLLTGAQIYCNSYLYYKYVASGDFSDYSTLAVGTDKALMSDVIPQLFANDPEYKPSYENWRLKRLAELIVHRGTKALTSYGTKSTHKTTTLGDLRSITRARCTAYPRYYEDMSTAALICEEIGLSLTPKRLTEVIPYEFIAQWFLPIEETIHSIEMNSARLESMYKLKNLCISRKDLIELDDEFLRAKFGLSFATGHLALKRYNRRSQLEFPPTALDLSLRPGLSLSRVMQGSSLIITRL